MKDAHLRFALNAIEDYPAPNLHDLFLDGHDDIPDERGIFIMGTSGANSTNNAGCQMFVYPCGTSPIYYIGCTSAKPSFGQKDSLHSTLFWLQYCMEDFREAKQSHRIILGEEHLSVAQYGAAFGAVVAWYLFDDVVWSIPYECDYEGDLRDKLIDSFRNTYGAHLVSNMVWS